MQKIGLNIFCEGLCEKKNLTSTLGPDSLIFSILARFSIFKVFYAIKTDIWSNENVSDFHLCNFSKISISYFLFKSKFGAKCILNCSRVVFIKRSNDFLAKKKKTSLEFLIFLKKQEAEESFPDFLCFGIVSITASEMELDYYQQKLNVRVASQAVE